MMNYLFQPVQIHQKSLIEEMIEEAVKHHLDGFMQTLEKHFINQIMKQGTALMTCRFFFKAIQMKITFD